MSTSNLTIRFDTTEEIINIDKLDTISTSLNIIGSDEVFTPIFENKVETDIKFLENLLEPVVLDIKTDLKTDLKAIIPLVTIKPEPNSFLIKIEQLVNYIKSTIGDEKINATNIIIISTNLMHIVEQYKDLTGYQKKMLILDAIKKTINENVIDHQERISLMMIVDMTLPQVLDTLVSAVNGNIKFEKDRLFLDLNNYFAVVVQNKNKNKK